MGKILHTERDASETASATQREEEKGFWRKVWEQIMLLFAWVN